VRGEFSGVTGSVVYDPQNPGNTRIEATIDAATINTRDEQRDQHLKSAEFLDVANFPKITFVSKKITPKGGGEWQATGDLTIRGITKEVTLQVEGPAPEVRDPWGNVKAGAEATAKVNRKDFGLVWNMPLETGGVLVGDEVTIHLELELLRQK